MDAISPWITAASATFSDAGLPHVYRKTCGNITFDVHSTGECLWALARWPGGGRAAVRLAYAPGDQLQLVRISETDQEVVFFLETLMGDFTVTLTFPDSDQPLLRYTTRLKPAAPLFVPFWPRDLLLLHREGQQGVPVGKVHVQQKGLRSGLLYLSMTDPGSGSLMYLQNLSALGDYCQQTRTSAADTVGGQWPELGFGLPPAPKHPLQAGREVTLSDAFLLFNTVIPSGEFEMARQFLDLLAGIYVYLPRPATTYHNWSQIVDKTLEQLQHNHGCWSQVKGHAYLNAYVSDYATPPEIMVQLAVLLPLIDYSRWSKRKLAVIDDIKAGLHAFYDERIGSIARWLPAAEKKLDDSEEHKSPRVMDSWYLHHPILNLSRMALNGEKVAIDLLYGSLDYAIRVAHHFDYKWPVFYNVDTLEVVKAETQPGKGGEKDVAGIYAHVMLQAWELTHEQRYLEEAKKAAKTLKGKGFDLFYQANNTAFSAGALLRLWKETGDEEYLQLSYLCLANIFKNVWLWDCSYGHGRHFPNFFAVFPLSDAPYTAVYEEQEVFSAFHDYLSHARGQNILPSVTLLLAEFIRFMVYRAVYYYPPSLPAEMLDEQTRTGELDPQLWIPVEDLHDGWEKSGGGGQEVYGAGMAFGIVPRHNWLVPGGNFMIFTDYPADDFSVKDNTASLTIKGSSSLGCRVLLMAVQGRPLPMLILHGSNGEITGKPTREGHMEYTVPGNQQLRIEWEQTQEAGHFEDTGHITSS